jgi:hypothetical protein
MAHGYGSYLAFTTTVASAATASSAIDLGGAYGNCYLAIQSMTSNSQLHIQASDKLDGTYSRVQHFPINSATVANNTYTILSSVTNAIVPIPAGLRYVKVERTATADSGHSYVILCGG